MKKKAVFLLLLFAVCAAFVFAAVRGRANQDKPFSDPEPLSGPEPPSVEETGRMIALTFDDGPDPVYTDQLLDILERYGAKATFFEIGEKLGDAPEALRREEELGCEVASHSYSHQKFSKISVEEVAEDMEASNEAFLEALGYVPKLLRPPYGVWSDALENGNYAAVTWSIDPADWQCRDAEEIVSFIQGLELDGQVILMHSLYESTVEAVQTLVPWLQEQGYELVTVSELMERRFGVEPEPGQFYDAHFFWSVLPSEPQSGSYSNFKAS